MDVYRLPIHLRNFYYKELIDAKKKEVENNQKSQKSSTQSNGPNVRVRK
jgi:hypothetical protein